MENSRSVYSRISLPFMEQKIHCRVQPIPHSHILLTSQCHPPCCTSASDVVCLPIRFSDQTFVFVCYLSHAITHSHSVTHSHLLPLSLSRSLCLTLTPSHTLTRWLSLTMSSSWLHFRIRGLSAHQIFWPNVCVRLLPLACYHTLTYSHSLTFSLALSASLSRSLTLSLANSLSLSLSLYLSRLLTMSHSTNRVFCECWYSSNQ
jgi:hypothetical protein